MYDVNTKELTARVRFGVVFYWTDPRMVGYDSPLLPPDLWGPDLYVNHVVDEPEKNFEQFVVLDSARGRLKRIINFHSTVAMPMDLTHFPFDVQELSVDMVTTSHVSPTTTTTAAATTTTTDTHTTKIRTYVASDSARGAALFIAPRDCAAGRTRQWTTLDRTLSGSVPLGQTYSLSPVSQPVCSRHTS